MHWRPNDATTPGKSSEGGMSGSPTPPLVQASDTEAAAHASFGGKMTSRRYEAASMDSLAMVEPPLPRGIMAVRAVSRCSRLCFLRSATALSEILDQ